MKRKTLLKTLSVLLITGIMQVQCYKLNTVVHADTYYGYNVVHEADNMVISSVELQGDAVEGKTLRLVVKNTDGEDITKYCHPRWCRIDKPTTDPNSIYVYNMYYGNDIFDNYIDTWASDGVQEYVPHKEDIGKYIGIIVSGKTSDGGEVNKGISTSTPVAANDSTHWQKEFIYTSIVGDMYEWYYLNDDGTKHAGWKLINGEWYYFEPREGGRMQYKWKYINGNWYYFQTEGTGKGRMLTNCWIQYILKERSNGEILDAKYYYLNSGGTITTNTTVDGHYLDSSGATYDIIDKSLLKK